MSDKIDPARVSLGDIFRYFLRLGALGFGGPVALVGYMERDLVERDRWLTKEEFSEGVALAAALPGPLAAQVAMWIGYLRHGFWGCSVASLGMIGPSFLMVLALSVLYLQYEEARWMRALFYGIGPVVSALIADSCYRLSKRYLPDGKMIRVAVVCLVVTLLARAELAVLFLLGGGVGVLLYARPFRRGKHRGSPPGTFSLLGPYLALSFSVLPRERLFQLMIFFFKAGLFTFGSGLAVAPFINQGLVIERGWLSERQFLDTVAVGMITPGPVVIMATLAGYLIRGFWGSVVAALGVFSPVCLTVLFLAPFLIRHREHPVVTAFAKGATAAAVGVISGAGIIIGRGVIVDWVTGVIAGFGFLLLLFWRIEGLLLVAGAGIVGLLIYP